MSGRFRFLAGKLRQMGKQNSDLAYYLGMSPGSISHRMTGRTDWTISEMYETLRYVGAQPEELHIYFPPQERKRRTA